MMDWKLFQINTWKQISTSQVGNEVFIQPLFIQGRLARHVSLFLNNVVIYFHKAQHIIIWELPSETTAVCCELLGAAQYTTTACCCHQANWKLSVSLKGTAEVGGVSLLYLKGQCTQQAKPSRLLRLHLAVILFRHLTFFSFIALYLFFWKIHTAISCLELACSV